jgi:acetyl esterase/lipase
MPLLPSALGILNALGRAQVGGVTRDVAYGRHGRCRLDVYHAAREDLPSPVIVFFYGGSWEEGDRADSLFVGAALAARGFTTVIADYRVFPEVRFPVFIEDAAEIVRWTVRSITGTGGDPRRILVMGHSAGAHLAAMLAFDQSWLKNIGLGGRDVLKGFIGLAGPYDFLPLHSETLKEIFGPEDRLAATQPINFVTSMVPPSFLATGRNDGTVEPGNSVRLAERIAATGGTAILKVYDHLSHRTLIGAFSPMLRFLGPVFDDVVAFAEEATDAPRVTEPRAEGVTA